MRTVSFSLILLFVFFQLGACDDSGGDSNFNSGNNINNQECVPGTITCDGWTASICDGSGHLTEQVCEMNCVNGTGCTGCQEGETYCQDNDVMVCNDNSELVFQEQCPENEACVFGECVNRCHPQLLTTSNVGCEFWAVDLDNEAMDQNDAAAQQYAVAIANTNDWPIHVTVYKNISRFGDPINEIISASQNGTPNPATIPANSLIQIDLPQREVDGAMGQNGTYSRNSGSGTFVSSHAYRIVTDGPAVAYQFNPIIQQFSNDASILIPTQSLGYHYYVMGWPTANPCGSDMFPQESIPDHTSVTIIGTTANTLVTVYPNHAVTASGGDSGLVIAETPKGTPITFTIGAFDVVNLESFQPKDVPMQDCLTSPHNGDFTGTTIESTSPVAVFSSLERGIGFGGAEPPPPPGGWGDDGCCTDHLEQQMFPTRALGWDYVISRSPVRSTDSSWKEPDLYRILATENNTVVTTS
ncbi:IgGFc-binding protein, partial [Myxococcota bacterium]|nr:IgGFc-binding protein [Myxococcota bacterium]